VSIRIGQTFDQVDGGGGVSRVCSCKSSGAISNLNEGNAGDSAGKPASGISKLAFRPGEALAAGDATGSCRNPPIGGSEAEAEAEAFSALAAIVCGSGADTGGAGFASTSAAGGGALGFAGLVGFASFSTNCSSRSKPLFASASS
jgi:hypothetical protein